MKPRPCCRPRRIAVLGAESTGKSTLARALAQQLDGLLVPECLREFCQAHERPPLRHEQAAIAAEQIQREQQALQAAQQQGKAWVVCDPGPLMTAIYSQHYFDDPSLLPAALDWQHGYAATLVCQPDIAWEPDGFLRDGPQVRAQVQALIHDTLKAHGLPWHAVCGQGAKRLARALASVPLVAHNQR